ncbi:plexin-A4 isoform X1, putative [Babesia ovata]|uniref:Plexin-A4 isoform X1, putative n=1 Tax=Babesia ovata TaxID=189622 RepID=A0A2H6K9P2_9APIC|nr:plexin-A4 isoform X1, putative [Babesia ovata]GBE59722.1 plexin-A4 isoform X1, putative [Babesia ovata]
MSIKSLLNRESVVGKPNLAAEHNVVNFKDHHDGLSGQLERGEGHQHGLDHLVFHHVGHRSLLRVYPELCAVLLEVPVAQLGDDLEWVQTRVLREGVRHHLKRLCECLDADLLHAIQRAGPGAEPVGECHLRGATTGYDGTLLYETPHDTKGVV